MKLEEIKQHLRQKQREAEEIGNDSSLSNATRANERGRVSAYHLALSLLEQLEPEPPEGTRYRVEVVTGAEPSSKILGRVNTTNFSERQNAESYYRSWAQDRSAMSVEMWEERLLKNT